MDKPGLRARMKEDLARLAREPEEFDRQSRQVQDSLRQSRLWASSPTLLIYSSLENEFPTWPLIRAALAEGKRVYLPRIGPGGSMDFLGWYGDLRGLKENRFGILEPQSSDIWALSDSAALCLVPGLAFDLEGGRLGRGAGFYDKFIRDCREAEQGAGILFLGLAFEIQILPRVPMDEKDQALDMVFSPGGPA